MKAYNAVYKYGHLYDRDSGRRILVPEGCKISVTVNEYDLLDSDPYNKTVKPLDKKDRLQKLSTKGFIHVIKILKEGQTMFFEISAGFKSQKTEAIKCTFELELLEDLFGGRKQVDNDYDLLECSCVVRACISENLPFFEPVYAHSLNDAYSKTYDFYFRLYGKQAANVKTKMMLESGGDKRILQSLLSKDRNPEFDLKDLVFK